MGSEVVDRRQRRRLESIEEALAHAVDIMAEEGVAGLSLGEVARRMGIRPPSLYVYFPSKHALYDALFARGWQLLFGALRAYEDEHPPVEDDLAAILLRFGREFARWSVENFAYAQLLFWRPVPGFVPSPQAYQAAIEMYEHNLGVFTELRRRGLVRADVAPDSVLRDWTVLVAGVISQQLANAPGEPFEKGRFTTALPGLVAMFAGHYGAPTRARASGQTKPAQTKAARTKPARTTPVRRGHAGNRRSDR